MKNLIEVIDILYIFWTMNEFFIYQNRQFITSTWKIKPIKNVQTYCRNRTKNFPTDGSYFKI